MKNIWTLLIRLCLMKSFKSIAVLGAVLLIAGCTYTNQITMTPKVEKMEISRPIPVEAALLITEESKNQIFRSSSYPDYRNNFPQYFIEPYQLPIGEAFEKAALQIFSQVFQKVRLIRSPEEAKNSKLIIELRLADFSLHLVYNVISFQFYFAVVDIQCKAKVTGTLINQGRTVWQKTIETPLETGYPLFSEFPKDSVGERASETVVLTLKALAIKMMEESIVPPWPVRGWLEELSQVNR